MFHNQNQADFQAMNSRLRCSVHGCDRLRDSISKHCTFHKLQKIRYGHPEAKAIQLHEYAQERKLIRKLYRYNKNHAGMKSIKNYFITSIKMARANPNGFFRYTWAGVPLKHVDRLIVRCGALWYCYMYQEPVDSWIRGLEHLDALVAMNIGSLSRNKVRRRKIKEFKLAGKQIRNKTGVFFILSARYAQKMEMLPSGLK